MLTRLVRMGLGSYWITFESNVPAIILVGFVPKEFKISEQANLVPPQNLLIGGEPCKLVPGCNTFFCAPHEYRIFVPVERETGDPPLIQIEGGFALRLRLRHVAALPAPTPVAVPAATLSRLNAMRGMPSRAQFASPMLATMMSTQSTSTDGSQQSNGSTLSNNNNDGSME